MEKAKDNAVRPYNPQPIYPSTQHQQQTQQLYASTTNQHQQQSQQIYGSTQHQQQAQPIYGSTLHQQPIYLSPPQPAASTTYQVPPAQPRHHVNYSLYNPMQRFPPLIPPTDIQQMFSKPFLINHKNNDKMNSSKKRRKNKKRKKMDTNNDINDIDTKSPPIKKRKINKNKSSPKRKSKNQKDKTKTKKQITLRRSSRIKQLNEKSNNNNNNIESADQTNNNNNNIQIVNNIKSADQIKCSNCQYSYYKSKKFIFSINYDVETVLNELKTNKISFKKCCSDYDNEFGTHFAETYKETNIADVLLILNNTLCGICVSTVTSPNIQCDGCDGWSHKECIYGKVPTKKQKYFCYFCK